MGLDLVEMVLDTEKHFAISLPDEELARIETVEAFCKLIRKKCVLQNGFKAASYTTIYQTIVSLLHSDFSIPVDKIHPGSRFVEDLGLD